MTWAEVLAVFNFIAWLLPIIIRSWMAFKYDSTSEHTISDQELGGIRRAITKLNLRGKKLNLGNGAEADRDIQKGSK